MQIDPLAGLNPEQQAAVAQTDGPTLILAGAGSGKTRVLTHRIANIVHKKEARPWQILAVTFTNKAAGELKQRVAHITPNGNEVSAGTFHSLFLGVLRRETKALGYPSNFSIYDESDSQRVIKVILDRFGEKDERPKAIKSGISTLKNDMVSFETADTLATSPRDKLVARVYPEYEKALKAHAAMDFDDLLLKPLNLFREYPAVLAKWSERWKYLHVDEYQDTNLVQFELMKILAGPKPNICVVGDDDQSIYGWRGARVENIFNFKDVFPGTKIFRLQQNYRSTQPILDLAHAIVSKSKIREEKKLWTNKKTGEQPIVIGVTSDLEEARQVVDRIARDVQLSGKRTFKDFAILYRTNSISWL